MEEPPRSDRDGVAIGMSSVPRFPEEIDPGTGSREKSAATEGWQIQFHQTLEAGNSHGTIVYLPT